MRKKLVTAMILLMYLSISAYAQESPSPWWESAIIEDTIIVGVEAADEEELLSITQPLTGKPYLQEEVDQVIEQLYATGTILNVDLFQSPVDDAKTLVNLYFEITEVLPLSRVVIQGNQRILTDELTGEIPLSAGRIYSTQEFEAIVPLLEEFYSSRGFDTVDITFTYNENEAGDGVVATYQIREYDWYINKPIKGFTFVGLNHVESSDLEDITYPYIGSQFSQALYKEIESKIQGIGSFSLIETEMQRGGVGNQDLYIQYTLTELPVIATIDIAENSGVKQSTLLNALTLKEGAFLSITKVNTGAEELVSLYKERGFNTISVDSSYTIDESANTVALVYTVSEGRQSKIEEISFAGNEFLDAAALKREIGSKVQSLFYKGFYQEDQITKDRQSIELAYQKLGYIDAKVTEVEVQEVPQEDETKRMVAVTFSITEGQQWFFGGLEVRGASVYSTEDFMSITRMSEGDVLNISQVQQDISNIADLYWNEGYVQNTIDIEEIRDSGNNTISYVMNITERGQASVEDVVIKGLEKTKEYVLTRELALNKGDIFSKKKYIQSAQNLYNTGLLTDVVPSISYGTDENTLIVTYTVTEGNQMNIGFGATFGGNVDGFPVSGFLSWEDSNLAGTGRDLTLSTELSPDSQSVTLSFSDDWVGDRRWSNSINLQFRRLQVKNGLIIGDGSPTTQFRDNEAYPYPFTSYEQWEALGKPTPDAADLMPYTSLKFTLGYSSGYTFMFDSGRLSIGGGPAVTLNRAVYDPVLYTPYDYLIGKYQEAWQLSNRLTLALSWDGRDLVNNTTRGYIVSQNFVYSGGILGGLSNYIKSSTSVSAFLKLFDIQGEKPIPVVASVNSTVSLLLDQYYAENGAYGDTWVTGISASMYEYLYIDGMTLARGITPQFYKEFLWDSSLDVSMQIAQNVLWGEAYVSATSVLGDLAEFGTTPLDWYFSAGVGIRLKVPGFPLGLYLVKNAMIENGGAFTWDGGAIFGSSSDETKGMKLVLAITTNLY